VAQLRHLLNKAVTVVTLLTGILFFFLPIYASTVFALESQDGGYTIDPVRRAFENEEISQSLLLSLRISFLSVLLTLVVLVPAVFWVHVITPSLRKSLEFASLVPLIIPPIVQGVGFLYSMPSFVKSTPYSLVFAYTILAMPFTYRALDAAFSSIDIKTLVQASQTLGSGTARTILRVILPNIKTGLFAGTFLILALVLGEFAYASLLLWDTFPTVLAVAGMSDASVAVALSILSLLGVWLLLNSISVLNRSQRGQIAMGVR
jgi:putative spermidine/putrescine transport system permease protein